MEVKPTLKEAQRIEMLFNSVEVELGRRWAFGEVPAVFKRRPAEHLRKVVKAWWHIYHESAAADQGRDRMTWERNPSLPAEALDTPALVKGLQRVRELVRLGPIRAYRAIHSHETSAVCLLEMVTAYYTEIKNEPPTE